MNLADFYARDLIRVNLRHANQTLDRVAGNPWLRVSRSDDPPAGFVGELSLSESAQHLNVGREGLAAETGPQRLLTRSGTFRSPGGRPGARAASGCSRPVQRREDWGGEEPILRTRFAGFAAGDSPCRASQDQGRIARLRH